MYDNNLDHVCFFNVHTFDAYHLVHLLPVAELLDPQTRYLVLCHMVNKQQYTQLLQK